MSPINLCKLSLRPFTSFTVKCSHLLNIFLLFIRSTVVQEIQIASIDLEDSSLYLPLSEVFIADKVRKFLDGEHELDTNEIQTFRECCTEFWLTGIKYA